MYILAILHTLDEEFRKGTRVGKNRRQAFVWFSASLGLFAVDRAWSIISTHYHARVVKLEKARDGGTVVLHLERPPSFQFQPGQYGLLQVPEIGHDWHPFSIGSDPESSELVFFIEVMGEGSWTARLTQPALVKALVAESAKVNLRGPFGYPVTGDPTHQPDTVIAVGTGTGIVPFFSFIHGRARQMALLSRGALWGSERLMVQRLTKQRDRRVSATIKSADASRDARLARRASSDGLVASAPIYVPGSLDRISADDRAMGFVTGAQLSFQLRSLQRPLRESATKRRLLRQVRDGTRLHEMIQRGVCTHRPATTVCSRPCGRINVHAHRLVPPHAPTLANAVVPWCLR